MSNPWVQGAITVVCTILASSGFWAIISKRMTKKDVQTELLLGLAHDRIMYLGMKYIERGYITKDEYDDLHRYLYAPYDKAGGNGSAKRVMEEVNKLPIKDRPN